MSEIKGIQVLRIGLLEEPDKLKQAKSTQPDVEDIATLYSQNGEWLNPINQKLGNQLNPKNDNPEKDETFWVKLPSDKSPQKIRDRLLREEFGYNTKDIKEFDKRTDNKGFYLHDDKAPERWATAKEVENWTNKDGYVKIDVSGERAQVLRNFRVGRVIDRSLEDINDPILRESLKDDLLKIYKENGLGKINAADRLMNLEIENHDDVAAIRKAIRTLADQKETQNNAVVQITAAKVGLADIAQTQNDIRKIFSDAERKSSNILAKMTEKRTTDSFLGLPKLKSPSEIISLDESFTKAFEKSKDLRKRVSDYKFDLERITQTAGGIDRITGKRDPNAKVNRIEAAWVNKRVADSYRAVGDESEANRREVMKRFYQVGSKERSRLNIYSFISRLRRGDYEMSAPNANLRTQQDLVPIKPQSKEFGEAPYKLETRKYESESTKTETTWKSGKRSSKITERIVHGFERNYQIEGSVRTEGVMTTKERDFKKNKRTFPEREFITTYEKSSKTFRSPELNRRGIGKASRAAGAAGAIDEWNRWMNFGINSRKATESIATADKVRRDYFVKNYYAAPPKPRELSVVRSNMERSVGKAKSNEIMKYVEEASYAVWTNE